MRPLKIADGIYDVGVKDWNIRDFHGYSTYMGTSYNAFLIVDDDKVVLIDTVKEPFTGQFMENIRKIIDPKKIDFIISNHAEMDHSGALPRVLHLIGEDKPVYCSKMGVRALSAHFNDKKIDYRVVKPGTEMKLGKRTLSFIETRMLHWPDSMFTYIKEDGILFSSDAFGQHYASHENFDDEMGVGLFDHAKKYFANILLPYAPRVEKLLESVEAMGLKLNMICPDHGILWRKQPEKILEHYASWARQETKDKVIVMYDTMWNSTEKMAKEIVDGARSTGVEVIPMSVRNWHRSDIMTELMDAKALVVGSPTLNNGIFPTLADVLSYMKGLKPQGKLGAAFGSYGWSGEAVKLLNKELEAMEFELIDDGIRTLYVPNQDALKESFDFGVRIGEAVKAKKG
ncbi:MBL fold metallo-hydrolase [Desulfoluna limicola]|uniref:MBL fold metallo-hydrolase n=1 Tax=Desulfoluna limicola TaxID=2810562 RepID=A0ABM7PJQ3_9BACT|nr:flavodoxin domain-containing protein [Desulfoluna limicola]BCS97306.1 MBL fold metallo-hydrolase [Desulfoluna limicola]